MYRTKPLFPYAEGCYSIMPVGLPKNFYPAEEDRVHRTKDYVICFDKNVPQDTKQRLIKEYDNYHKEMKETGIFY